MSEAVYSNCKLYVAQYDLSGAMNALAIDMAAETPEATAMGATAKARLGGLRDVSLAHNGWFDGDPEEILWTQMGLTNAVMTAAPTGADGEAGFFFRPAISAYSPGAKLGDVYAFSVKGEGAGPLIRGTILLPRSTKTVTGTGTGRQLGAVSATQRLYAALHVFMASAGDTLDVIIQSDNASNFLSPATAITFTQIAAAGFEWKEVSGPITDDWFRVSYTIAGVDPSFNFAVICGIL